GAGSAGTAPPRTRRAHSRSRPPPRTATPRVPPGSPIRIFPQRRRRLGTDVPLAQLLDVLARAGLKLGVGAALDIAIPELERRAIIAKRLVGEGEVVIGFAVGHEKDLLTH